MRAIFVAPVGLPPIPETHTREEVRRDLGLEAAEVERNTCRVCGEHIRVQIFRDSGFCSGRCRESGFGQLITEARTQ